MIVRKAILIASWLFSIGLLAQDNITAMEYYIDDDPGIGGGTSISITPGLNQDVDVNISTGSLSVGFHELVIRTQDSGGDWSIQQSKVFYVSEANVDAQDQIVMIEYFFGNDPGVGAGTSIDVADSESVDLEQLVASSSLSSGFHSLSIRVQDENDLWSLPVSKTFFTIESDVTSDEDVTSLEYFFDTDPGVGAGTSLAVADDTMIDVDHMLATNTLSVGFHTINIRAQDASGNWSLAKSQSFYVGEIVSNSSNRMLSSIEYFIDIDPGLGTGTQITVDPPANTIDEDLIVSTSNLANGTYSIGARVADEDGNYSVTTSAEFTICDAPAISFSANTVCTGSATDFTDLSESEDGDVYSWDFDGDGNEDSDTVGDVSFTYPSSGEYTAVLTIDGGGGCVSSHEIAVFVEELPTANAGSDQTITIDQTTMDATAADEGETGVWSIVSGSGTIADENDPTSEVTSISTDELVLSWTVSNDVAGCSDEDEVIITVDIPLSTDTDILTFELQEQIETTIINSTSHTVSVTVLYGTDVTSLTPTITISDGASISPTSGTVQSFVEPVVYMVTAEDGEAVQDWIVTVVEDPNDETDILSFDFENIDEEVTIDITSHAIDVIVPDGTNVTALTPSITVSDGATISPSGVQDFSNSVEYTVTAEDGETIQVWTVTVSEPLSTEAEILAFTLSEQTEVAVINSSESTIILLVELGTDLTALEPSITVSEGASVNPSGVQNFINAVIYTVTAEDGVTTKEWVTTIEERPLSLNRFNIEVFPNPVYDKLYVSGLDGDFQYRVIDMSGRTLISGKGANEILLQNLPEGTYTLLIEKDNVRLDKRIIKH